MIHTVGGSNVSCKLFWKILAEYSLHSLLEGSQRLIEYKNCNQTDDEHLMKHGSLCLSLLTLFLSSKTNSWHRNLSTLKDVIHQTLKHNYIFFLGLFGLCHYLREPCMCVRTVSLYVAVTICV